MSLITQDRGMDRAAVEQVVREVVRQRLGRPRPAASPSGAPAGARPELRVNISARHMHITQHDLETLFGPGAKLTVFRPLYQDGYFASEQMVTIIGPRHRTITNLRILGPCRPENQIELAFTDGVAMGIDLPVRMSGNIKDTPGCIVLGPKGYIEMKEGVIRAMRHVHLNPDEAAYYNVGDGDLMKLHVEGDCGMTIEGVIARIAKGLKLEVHLDTDEGNACNLTGAKRVELIK
ncbi:MAG TPA: phosphate propanoyltransferase [Phycisphaerae bacterium]|nr:phosphate propanoyltransferase [Phycisphaerae bacterium]HRY67772.1 phosphate propanoyltransferase [Phycisphaerae bacterium]HSA25224.1 phosphate propanoyltransferase [Phycisphaerae bacterium]